MFWLSRYRTAGPTPLAVSLVRVGVGCAWDELTTAQLQPGAGRGMSAPGRSTELAEEVPAQLPSGPAQPRILRLPIHAWSLGSLPQTWAGLLVRVHLLLVWVQVCGGSHRGHCVRLSTWVPVINHGGRVDLCRLALHHVDPESLG